MECETNVYPKIKSLLDFIDDEISKLDVIHKGPTLNKEGYKQVLIDVKNRIWMILNSTD